MNISGKSESSGKPRTTADIAAAARRGDATATNADMDELPVVAGEQTVESRETTPASRQRGEEAQQRARVREKADTLEAGQATRDRSEAWGRGDSAGRGDTTQQRTQERVETPERVDVLQRARAQERVETSERKDSQQQRARVQEHVDTSERMGSEQRARAQDSQWATADEPSGSGARPGQRAQSGLSDQPVVVERPNDAARRDETEPSQEHAAEALEALFTAELAESYRMRWTSIQSSFVDDPRHAVRKGDELVAEIMTNLADSFSQERRRLESQLDKTGEGTTENLRVALRRYRSFFERLLSL